MNTDRWVMVRDNDDNATDDWEPRVFLRELDSRLPYRYLCLSQNEDRACVWRQMRPAKASELLPMLPGEWAARAMMRVNQCPLKEDPEADNLAEDPEVDNLADALTHAFSWTKTHEWYWAWRSLRDALRYGKPIPECPPLAGEPAPAPEQRCTCGRIVRVSYEFFEEVK